jgi:hypothetical protein
VIPLRKTHGYLIYQVGNADQTPLWFSMLESFTVEHVGVRLDQVRMTDADEQ